MVYDIIKLIKCKIVEGMSLSNIQEIPEFLYHYTSINTLALILKNKTICFNNLLYVDDLEEVETKDMGKFGRYCCVSCWSGESNESIPLWNMYTPGMSGVRIKLPKFPFKKYVIEKNEMDNVEKIETYIDMKKNMKSDNALIANYYPEIVKVEYTEDEKLLYPEIKSETIGIENSNNVTTTSYTILPIGKYKRSNWAFQNEWRYKIFAMPYTYTELGMCKTVEDQQRLIARLEDVEQAIPYNKIFLEIDKACLKNMEIVLGPKATEADEIIVKTLVEKYCSTAKVYRSSLKVR